MQIPPALLRAAVQELGSMVDAVRDESPSWQAVMSAMFGDGTPGLGAVRRAVSDPKMASFVRAPMERAVGRNLRAVDDLAEAIHEVAVAPSTADPKALRAAHAFASSLEARTLADAK